MTPGCYDLGDFAVSEEADETGEPITSFAGMESVRLQARFALVGEAGSGAAVDVFVETSLDQAASWVQVAHFAFTSAGAVKACNVSARTPVAIYAPATLSADAVKDGILGDRLRARVECAGGYDDGSLVSVRAVIS